MEYNGYLGRVMQRDRYCKNLKGPTLDDALQLQPLQHLVYADNNQMMMFRNDLFMSRAVTSTLQGGEKTASIQTWGLFDTNAT